MAKKKAKPAMAAYKSKSHCGGFWWWLVLIVGVLFLLRDLGFWSFWNIQPWTAVFVLLGLAKLGKK